MEKKSPRYSIARLAGRDYLLPFGQGIVDQQGAYEVNDTALFLWSRADDFEEPEDLFRAWVQHDRIPPEQLEEARADFEACMRSLERCHLLDGPAPLRFPAEPHYKRVEIAHLAIDFQGSPNFFPAGYVPFATPDPLGKGTADQTVTVTLALPRPCPGARVLLENDQLAVLDEGDLWRLAYPGFRHVRLVRVTKDGSRVALHVSPVCHDDEGGMERLRFEVFHALRLPFLVRAEQERMYALHSCSLLYRGKAWLVSAPSGTGKSTHARLWETLGYATVLNGDLNLIRADTMSVCGIPWCGTSGIATTQEVPLGGVILLTRGKTDRLIPIREDQKQLRTMQRLISPLWTEQMLGDCVGFSQELAQRVPVWSLSATTRPTAARLMKNAVDSWLDDGEGAR